MQKLSQAEDIRKEPLITKKWSFKKSISSSYSDGILITGANSFIGAHVISILPSQWKGTVHLLLRAATKQEAVDKMKRAFMQWELGTFQSENSSIHLGDVTMKMMGLKPAEYAELKKNVGFVLHLALYPLHNLPYTHFKRLWIPELEQMILFCGDNDYPKSLHYPSSFNTIFFTEAKDFLNLNSNVWQSGYTGFKWVAGNSLKNAFDQGLQGCRYDIPLVLGSRHKGVCPSYYSIWHFFEIFLKTGMYIDFAFRIIPVDVLSNVIVTNIMNDKNGTGSQFLRPVLDEVVTHKQFGNMVANILGLNHTTTEKLRAAFNDKQKFDFMVPKNFNALLEKVNTLHAVWPNGFPTHGFLPASMVFLGNLNRLLHSKQARQSIYI